MFKLLPEKDRQKLAREYAARRIIVILLGMIAAFLMGLIGLLPSYVLTSARQSEVREQIRITEGTKADSDRPNLKIWLDSINQKLTFLSPKSDVDRPSNLIEKTLDQRMTGISITSFSWTKVDGKVTLSIKGVARDRQTLLAYENKLNSSGFFSDINLPLSNLTKDKNINFEIKFLPL